MKHPVYRIMCVFSNKERLQFNSWEPEVIKEFANNDGEMDIYDYFEKRLALWLKEMQMEASLQRCKLDLTHQSNSISLMSVWHLSKPIYQRWMTDASLIGFELWCSDSHDCHAIHSIFQLRLPLLERGSMCK